MNKRLHPNFGVSGELNKNNSSSSNNNNNNNNNTDAVIALLCFFQLIMTDPTDIRAKTRSKLRLPRQLADNKLIIPHQLKELNVTQKKKKHLTDIDEFAMEANRVNRGKSWGISFQRVRLIGNYGKNEKLTVMLPEEAGDSNIPNHLSGSIAQPCRWVWVQRLAGTTGDTFAAFVGMICSAVEDHAYQPKYRPIEYVICELVNHLKMNTRGQVDLDCMEQQIVQAAAAAAAIGPFNNIFAHCGRYSKDGTYPVSPS
eukprot:jgi/Psemu1/14892/gm1.14892_g